MVSGHLSALLMDWTSAVTELNTLTAHQLLEKEPELLWTPIPQSLDDTDHLQDQLTQLNKLGSSFQPVSAIQFTLLHYRDMGLHEDRFKFLSYLIEQSSLHDLDTRFWGECNNSTLHLVCFLAFDRILKLLIEKGVSVTPSNDLGFFPKDVTMSDSILHTLSTCPKTIKKDDSILRTKSVRPNYSTPDRFKLLRDLAEESSADPKRSLAGSIEKEGHYFRKGRVRETQQKVLTEEEILKKGSKRQLEVAQLVKKSAVKNNPLWKKMEKRSFTSPTPSPSTSATIVTEPAESTPILKQEEPTPKRNSKVILSLQTKSYVSSSIFVQADEDIVSIPPIPAKSIETPPPEAEPCVTEPDLGGNEPQAVLSEEDHYAFYDKQSSDEEDDSYFEAASKVVVPPIDPQDYYEDEAKQDTQTSSDDYSDDEDNEYEEATPVQFATRLVSPIYKSVVIMNEDAPIKQDTTYFKPEISEGTTASAAAAADVNLAQFNTNESDALSRVSATTTTLEQVDKNLFNFVEPSSPPTVRPQPSDLRWSSNSTTSTPPLMAEETPFIKTPSVEKLPIVERPRPVPELNVAEKPLKVDVSPVVDIVHQTNESPIKDTSPGLEAAKDKKRMSGSQKAAWTMSMSSWAAILDREFNLDELQKQQLAQAQVDESSTPKPVTPTVTVRPAESLSEKKTVTSKPKQTTDARLSTAAGLATASTRLSTATKKSTAVTRHSTATLDYIGGEKLQLSDEEMDTMMLRHGYSTTHVENMSPVRSSSMVSLSFHDFEIPAIPPPTSHPSYQSKAPLPPTTRAPQLTELPRLDTSNLVQRKPIVASISEASITKKNISNKTKKVNAAIPAINLEKKSLKHGKLYLHVNGIQDILLPLPKERAYVRCVVSDGRFEYMSRYEILAQNINFDYECVIDTHPDMIITISLHVRPDYIMKSRTPFSRLFSSKKKKESLSGYVNKEDGAIGQARFALAHMLPACIETTYLAGFHCFNAWYSRSFKERHRQKKKDPDHDVLKVVGNFDVEMLYLPVADFQKPFPRNLRECDAAIKELHKAVEESSEKYLTY